MSSSSEEESRCLFRLYDFSERVSMGEGACPSVDGLKNPLPVVPADKGLPYDLSGYDCCPKGVSGGGGGTKHWLLEVGPLG